MDFKIHRASVLTAKTKKTATIAHRRLGCVLILLIMLSLLSGCGKKQLTPEEAVKQTVQYQLKTVPRPESASIGGEWTLLSVLRSGEEVPDSYQEIYLTNLKKRLKETDGVLSEEKYTEYARAALAAAALGEDAGNIDGYDLLTPLTDLEQVTQQGINGAAFALLALDTAKNQNRVLETAKAELRDWLLEQELPAGGFALEREENAQADIDVTAMAVQALAPYQEEEQTADVIERAVIVLAEAQKADGTYESWGETSCETVAQVWIALSALEIDGQEDSRFVKADKGLFDILMTFSDGKGGFSHLRDGENDAMATDQALCALDAYQRYRSGDRAFYDMSDSR